MNLSDKIAILFKRDLLLFFTTLITNILVARHLGSNVLGIWTIFIMVVAYAETLARLKVDIASVYFLGKKKVFTRRYSL